MVISIKKDYQNTQATEKYRALLADLSRMPFSFIYDGKKYTGFAAVDFTLKNKEVTQGTDKEIQRLTFAFQNTLDVTLILTHYFSHGVTEWTVWFENTSEENSGIRMDFPESRKAGERSHRTSGIQ